MTTQTAREKFERSHVRQIKKQGTPEEWARITAPKLFQERPWATKRYGVCLQIWKGWKACCFSTGPDYYTVEIRVGKFRTAYHNYITLTEEEAQRAIAAVQLIWKEEFNIRVLDEEAWDRMLKERRRR